MDVEPPFVEEPSEAEGAEGAEGVEGAEGANSQSQLVRLVPELQQSDAHVLVIEQPSNKPYRFRYSSSEGYSGCIYGASSTPENPTYPAIKIIGHIGPVCIVVSLVTIDKPYRPHPHKLTSEDNNRDDIISVLLEVTNEHNEYHFRNIGIRCVTWNEVADSLRTRRRLRIDPFKTGYSSNKLKRKDLKAVRLAFQVLLLDSNHKPYECLPSVVSNAIYNDNAVMNLTIKHYSQCTGPMRGGTVLIVMCYRLLAGEQIEVVFHHTDERGRQWRALATNVQLVSNALKFHTPPFKHHNPFQSVTVHFYLRCVSDGQEFTSQSLSFEYLPECRGSTTFVNPGDDYINQKRKKMIMSSLTQTETSYEQNNTPSTSYGNQHDRGMTVQGVPIVGELRHQLLLQRAGSLQVAAHNIPPTEPHLSTNKQVYMIPPTQGFTSPVFPVSTQRASDTTLPRYTPPTNRSVQHTVPAMCHISPRRTMSIDPSLQHAAPAMDQMSPRRALSIDPSLKHAAPAMDQMRPRRTMSIDPSLQHAAPAMDQMSPRRTMSIDPSLQHAAPAMDQMRPRRTMSIDPSLQHAAPAMDQMSPRRTMSIDPSVQHAAPAMDQMSPRRTMYIDPSLQHAAPAMDQMSPRRALSIDPSLKHAAPAMDQMRPRRTMSIDPTLQHAAPAMDQMSPRRTMSIDPSVQHAAPAMDQMSPRRTMYIDPSLQHAAPARDQMSPRRTMSIDPSLQHAAPAMDQMSPRRTMSIDPSLQHAAPAMAQMSPRRTMSIDPSLQHAAPAMAQMSPRRTMSIDPSLQHAAPAMAQMSPRRTLSMDQSVQYTTPSMDQMSPRRALSMDPSVQHAVPVMDKMSPRRALSIDPYLKHAAPGVDQLIPGSTTPLISMQNVAPVMDQMISKYTLSMDQSMQNVLSAINQSLHELNNSSPTDPFISDLSLPEDQSMQDIAMSTNESPLACISPMGSSTHNGNESMAPSTLHMPVLMDESVHDITPPILPSMHSGVSHSAMQVESPNMEHKNNYVQDQEHEQLIEELYELYEEYWHRHGSTTSDS